MTEPLVFEDITRQQVPVKIAGEDYVLIEANGDVVYKYRNAVLKATRMSSTGKLQSVDGLADTEPLLVSLCMFKVIQGMDGKPKHHPVSLATVRAWPAHVCKALFDKAKAISRLDEDRDTVKTLDEKILELQQRREQLAAANGNPNHTMEYRQDREPSMEQLVQEGN